MKCVSGDEGCCSFSEDLVKRVRREIRERLSARHVPHIILEIADIPVSLPLSHTLTFTPPPSPLSSLSLVYHQL